MPLRSLKVWWDDWFQFLFESNKTMINKGVQAVSIVLLLGTIGCQDRQAVVVQSNDTQETSAEPEQVHTHSDADKLVWVQSDIEAGDFVISLGHHGTHFHGGDEIEPAVSISRGGKDIADAVVHNCLVAEGGETVLCEERETIFEPKTDEEPAHYAQGGLAIPKETRTFLIRFRIQLPEVDAEATYDIEVESH